MSNKLRQAHLTVFPLDKENYIFTQEELDKYYNGYDNHKVKAYIVQGEYTKDKKQHLQIYMQFTGQLRYNEIKKHLQDDTIHIEPITYGKTEDCINYCTDKYIDKDGNPKDIFKTHQQFGEFKIQGKRSDLEEVVIRIKDGERLNKIIIEEPKVARLYCQYSRGLREVENIIRQSSITEELKKDYDNVIWRQWQKELIEYIEQPTDKRKIRWIYETEGNTGKSYITKYLTLFKDAYVITGGRKEDILYAYDGQEIIIFDLPRDFEKDKQYIYEVMEILKNGQYLSTKYQTIMKTFKIPKIIVMANFEPDYEKLSKDRYDVINISIPQNPYKYSTELEEFDLDDEPHIHVKYTEKLSTHRRLMNKIKQLNKKLNNIY